MQGIMFSTKYGLEDAVLCGSKTRTFRADKKPRYKVGEIVAIKESYETIFRTNKAHCRKIGMTDEDGFILLNFLASPGWNNKMFVRPELMPHHIRITAVKPCRLQDITDDECLQEGIAYVSIIEKYYFQRQDEEGFYFLTAKNAFASLIDKVNGKGYWNTNPQGYAYEFELIE